MGTAPTKPVLSDISVKRGQDITLIWNDKTEAKAKWMKDGRILENGDRINITQSKDGKTARLVITGAKEADEGEYTLTMSNRKGEQSCSARITVLEFDVDWRKIDWRKNNLKGFLGNFTFSNKEVSHLRFLLYGPVGAGKSSIINSINSVFQGRIVVKAMAAHSDKSCTKTFRTHVIKDKDGKELPFAFNDIMGLENAEEGGALPADIISALKGHVRDGYRFESSPLSEKSEHFNSSPTLNDKPHCLVCVIPADRITLQRRTDGVIKKMREIREAACDLEIPQVVFMTHVDKCCSLVKENLTHVYSSKNIKRVMQHCSNELGVPMNCIFPVKNYHEENNVDEKIDCLMLHALNQIVNFANDYVN